jgi:hypothetical protein
VWSLSAGGDKPLAFLKFLTLHPDIRMHTRSRFYFSPIESYLPELNTWHSFQAKEGSDQPTNFDVFLVTDGTRGADLLSIEVVFYEPWKIEANPIRPRAEAFLDSLAARYFSAPDKLTFYVPKEGKWRFKGMETHLNLTIDMFGETARALKRELEWYLNAQDNPLVTQSLQYFLTGPSGVGKNELVRFLASSLRLSLYILQLTEFNDSLLSHLLTEVPPRSIVLLDEAYQSLHNRITASTEAQNGVSGLTTGGVLSALDGPQKIKKGVILFFVDTNVEKCRDLFRDEGGQDPLTRDGRLELVKLDYMQPVEIKEVTSHFIRQLQLPTVRIHDQAWWTAENATETFLEEFNARRGARNVTPMMLKKLILKSARVLSLVERNQVLEALLL